MADIHVLSLMAKQILSKQIKLPGGVKVQDGLHVLVDGSLEQKRSILITQPSLLTAMIKKSKSKLQTTPKQKSAKPTTAHRLQGYYKYEDRSVKGHIIHGQSS